MNKILPIILVVVLSGCGATDKDSAVGAELLCKEKKPRQHSLGGYHDGIFAIKFINKELVTVYGTLTDVGSNHRIKNNKGQTYKYESSHASIRIGTPYEIFVDRVTLEASKFSRIFKINFKFSCELNEDAVEIMKARIDVRIQGEKREDYESKKRTDKYLKEAEEEEDEIRKKRQF
jgi:hypothetical protein